MNTRVTTIVEACGLIMLVVGVGFFSIGASLIVGGVALIAIGVLQ
jgi:hypothetical protein